MTVPGSRVLTGDAPRGRRSLDVTDGRDAGNGPRVNLSGAHSDPRRGRFGVTGRANPFPPPELSEAFRHRDAGASILL